MTRMKTTLAALAALALPLALATNAFADRDRDHGRGHDRGGWVVRPIIGFAHAVMSDCHRPAVVVRSEPVRCGHWTTVTRQVLVQPGYWDVRTTAAVYEYHRGWHGRTVQVCVRPAETVRVWVPARYEAVAERVWVYD